jgi:acetylglutamate kinase
VGAVREARFYADLFSAQDPEKFALFLIDARCLHKPLLEALIANVRILTDLGLYPTLLIGALADDPASIEKNAKRLSGELSAANVNNRIIETGSERLISTVRETSAIDHVPVVYVTEEQGQFNLLGMAKKLCPGKIICLQPSGGISARGRRVPVINIDNQTLPYDAAGLSPGQAMFMKIATFLSAELPSTSAFVMASPLNLLAELFTTKGSGTLIRRGAKIHMYEDLSQVDAETVSRSIDAGFDKTLKPDFLNTAIHRIFIESQYRGGAILINRAGLPYLSKFWVVPEAQGEGIARDLWEALRKEVPALFWRSRRSNPFNDWYMRKCDGMQVSGDWRVFWIGLASGDIPKAIDIASQSPEDFVISTKT